MAKTPRFTTQGKTADGSGDVPGQGSQDSLDSQGPADPKHPVDQGMPPLKLFTTGLQHVAAMYAGVVAPPLVVGAAVGLSPTELAFLTGASLFLAGIVTLFQTLGFWKIGSRLPFVNGATFAAVAPMLAIAKSSGPEDTLPVIFGATIVAAALGFVIAPFFSKLIRFFPPVVTGSVITLIGVSLMPVSFNWAMGGDEKSPHHGDFANIGMAGLTLVIVLVLRRFTTGFMKQIAVLIGLVIGTLIAIPVGITDFTAVTESDPVGFPTPFHFGAPQFAIPAIVSMCVVMLVSMTESTADMLALGEVVDRPADRKTIAGGLRADMLGSALSPFFNGFMCSAFAQNIGLVAMTRIRSRYVVATGGALLILLGLSPMAAGLVASVPQPVLGGAGVVLFGSVAASGIQTLMKADLSKDNNVLIVGTALAVGLIPIAAPDFYHAFPDSAKIILDSGISTGCVTAIVLNLVFNHLGRSRRDEEVVAHPMEPGEGISYERDEPDPVHGPDKAPA
ncbi:nucleobase:cation symporter-2 family protein [Streptomyces reniochalinae]|uniref:Purine permease n=1 Tax=Streptomyces reniochalinae TaxID=2250578 RepID=A0A367ECZ1_9ACTN|nr:nucleobase:cation symporter-2 family protein [Streptomyces reniochalinae]RCG15936.1 purine permease [Streptomyces reniochalinae]